MRSTLAGLLALAALLAPSGANAAMQVLCNWEGTAPVAITVEGDVYDFRYYGFFRGGNYYDIEATRSGLWMLLDEPKPVLSIRLIRSEEPADVVLDVQASGRCWM